MSERVAILDAGAQYGKLIDRRVRELNVESEILPLNTRVAILKDYRALIISGGPRSVYGRNAPEYDPDLFSLGIPTLGDCYGMQLIALHFGGLVEKTSRREDGSCEIVVDPHSKLFIGLEPRQEVLMSHGDSVTSLPKGFGISAISSGLIAGIEYPEANIYGVQFHPEVDLTLNGKQILQNFLYNIANFSGTYTLEDRIQKAMNYIRDTVGEKQVLVLVSGGVDSAVCATLLARCLGPDRIHAIHINNGFMRLDESAKVSKALSEVGINLRVVEAEEDFYHPLSGVIHPEQKRIIIGDQFMVIAQNEIEKLGLNPDQVVLAQGTLRPDLIESASQLTSTSAATIKTHHNDTPLVRELRSRNQVVEPLQDYHKDEVRTLGEKLGLPSELVWRQPFPGPGLAIRILCADNPYITDEFDEINDTLKKYGNTDLAVNLLPVQTVGVQGDGRTYSYLVGLSGKRNWDELFRVAREIPKEVHQINRVVFLFGEQVFKLIINITPTHLDKEVIRQLQLADEVVNQIIYKYDLVRRLSQVPVILFPVHFGKPGERSVAIRTFITRDFMTGMPAKPGQDISEEVLDEMVNGILSRVPRISRVAYDLTSKPPGTTEWE